MKTLIKSLFVIILCMALSVYAFGSTNNASFTENEITLKGTIHDPGRPRVPQAPALEAYQNFDSITVYFLTDLGNVIATITDECGEVVYQSTEPSGEGVTVEIDTSELESGFYTITFTNPGGFYRYGEFDL